MNIIMLGAPGAGKGTQAAVLSEHFGIPTISTGNMIREALKNGTEMGLKAKSFMDEGKLVPDEVVIGIVKERLSEDDCKKGFILDGFPRTIAQADALKEMTELDGVINFVLSEEEIIKRLSGRRICKSTGRTYHIIFNPPRVEGKDDETGEDLIQRDDDKPEAIKHRLDVYKESTEPLIAYYRDKGLVLDLMCTNDPEETNQNFFALIKK